MVGVCLKLFKRRAIISFVAFISPALVYSVAFAAQPISPFFTFNQSPVIQIHGLPPIESAGVLSSGQSRYKLVNDLASNYTNKLKGNELIIFDGEINRSTFVFAQGLSQSFEWGIQIPYVTHSPGSLDAFIEDWHDFFGFPQGGRDTAVKDRLLYQYQENGITQLRLDKHSSGIGDVSLTGAWQWSQENAPTRLALRGALSLPSGDSDKLLGSGSTDAAFWVSADRNKNWFDFPGGVYGGGGVLLMGDGDVLSDKQRRAALFGSFGGGAKVLPWVTLKVQTDFHSPLYKSSQLDQINATAIQIIMGGDLQLTKKVKLDIAVGEDITVKASPDVVFHLGLTVTD